MIVEERIYHLHVGKGAEYQRLYGEEGLAIQAPILGRMVGWFLTGDVGEQNVLVHLWGYDDMADRERRRARLVAEPAWKAFVQKVRPLIVRQESRILLPAPWSPVGGSAPVTGGEA